MLAQLLLLLFYNLFYSAWGISKTRERDTRVVPAAWENKKRWNEII
jgi:hypothetical protein